MHPEFDQASIHEDQRALVSATSCHNEVTNLAYTTASNHPSFSNTFSPSPFPARRSETEQGNSTAEMSYCLPRRILINRLRSLDSDPSCEAVDFGGDCEEGFALSLLLIGTRCKLRKLCHRRQEQPSPRPSTLPRLGHLHSKTIRENHHGRRPSQLALQGHCGTTEILQPTILYHDDEDMPELNAVRPQEDQQTRRPTLGDELTPQPHPDHPSRPSTGRWGWHMSRPATDAVQPVR